MFIIWWDDLMTISKLVRTTALRQLFISKYGFTAYRNWMGLDRQ